MAAGFSANQYSKAGRKIKPSEKVRALMKTSLQGNLQILSSELDQLCGVVQQAMLSKQPREQLLELLDKWIELYCHVLEVESELCSNLDRTELYEHRDSFSPRADYYGQVKVDVFACLDSVQRDGGAGHPDEPDVSMKRKYKKLQTKSSAIDKEIANLKAEMTALSVSPVQGPNTSSPYSYPPQSPGASRARSKSQPSFDRSIQWPVVPSSNDRNNLTTPVAKKPSSIEKPDSTTLLVEALNRVFKQKENKLPDKEPEMFSGELLDFPLWWSSFVTLVEKVVSSSGERMYYLNRYTTGEAKRLISGFQTVHDDDETTYERARSLLLSRYGNRRKIADAFRKRLTDWPVLKRNDADGLQKYSDFLWQCHANMSQISYLQGLSSYDENVKLAQKLPNFIIDRWNRFIDRWVHEELPDNTRTESQEERDYPPFYEFCKFVAGEARYLSNASVPRHQDRERTESASKTRKHVSYATQAKPESATGAAKKDLKCFYCQEEHFVSNCKTFLSKPSAEKRAFAGEAHLCYGCLRRGHSYRDCKHKNPELLKDTPQKACMKIRTEKDDLYFSMVVPVRLYHKSNPSCYVDTRAILDTQADGCFLQQSLVDELGAKSSEVSLKLTTMGRCDYVKCQEVEGLAVKGAYEPTGVLLPPCYTQEHLHVDEKSIPTPEAVAQWPHLDAIASKLKPLKSEEKAGILIGFNCPELLVQDQLIKGEEGDPVAVHTVLGWSVLGLVNGVTNQRSTRFCYRTSASLVAATPEEVSRAFDNDFLESREEKTSKMSIEDLEFLKIMNSTVRQKEDGHMEVALPFRERPENLPDNRDQAYGCLMSLKRKLQRDKTLAKQYKDFIDDMIEQGHAEKVTPEMKTKEGQAWRLTHLGVVHPRKPGKLRVVWNASAMKNGVSLNQMLLQGPDMTNSLIGVLSRFREEKYAFTCDVKGMFHQVSVPEADRDYLRFLWFKDGDPEGEIEELRMTVHLFGATSSPGCANFAFKRAAEQHENKYGSDTTKFVQRGFYVDDGLNSKQTKQKMLEQMKASHECCKDGGFFLHKFVTNVELTEEEFPQKLMSPKAANVALNDSLAPIEGTLGMEWNYRTDEFLFRVTMLEKPATRRGMLSSLSSIYDPVGLISPAILPGRLLLKNLCDAKMLWDEQVPKSDQDVWDLWYQSLAKLSLLRIPRCVKRSISSEVKIYQLHHFCDASTVGYGVCSYLKMVDDNGCCDVTLMMAKSRVAPQKITTVPRLELQAAVLGARMSLFLQSELNYPQAENYYWTDSRVVLGYLQNAKKKFHLYVTNRVQSIREMTDVNQWRYVKTTVNPADIASRGLPVEELIHKDLWWHGPRYLTQQHAFPAEGKHEVMEDDPEVKTASCYKIEAKPYQNPVVKAMESVSCWNKIKRLTARWIRYKEILKNKIDKSRPYEPMPKFLTVPELYKAEQFLIRESQKAELPEVYESLRKEGTYPDGRNSSRKRKEKMKEYSNLYRLDLYMDECQVLRVGGRIKRASLPLDLIHPRLLPRGGHISEKIIFYHHVRTRHQGRGVTLGTIRASGYWVPQGRVIVEKQLRDCVECSKLRRNPPKQKMSDLPEDRMTESPPFTYVGMDIFGPFYIKQQRSLRKRWGCIFTCLVSRACHIEPVFTMETDSFINAYRRFISRRGPVRVLRSDCGTNFKGAKGELEAALAELDTDRIQRELSEEGCDFVEYKFNFPKSSHMGGAWERMIQSVRSSMAFLLAIHGDQLDDETLMTLFAEAEAIVNSRPLTYMSMSTIDEPPITPSQLLTMKSQVVMPPPGDFPREDVYSRKRWRRVQYLAGQFWIKWRHEYLLGLQGRAKWLDQEDNMQVNDVVLLVDDQAPRNKWRRGIVKEVFPSEDGLVRKLLVKTSSSEFLRPISKVVLIYRERTEDPETEEAE